jgi:hypothetical protein
LSRIVVGWNTQKWKPSDCSLPFLVEWRKCLPFWPWANVPHFGRCIHDNRPGSHRNCVSTQVQGLLQANRSENRGWI